MRCSDDAEKRKNAPQVFPGFPIIKSARHCGKITFFKKKCAFYGNGFRSGGIFIYIYIYVCVCARMFVIVYDCLCILLGTCKQEKCWWDTLGQTWGQTDQLKMQPLSRLHAQVTPATRTEIINLNFWGMGLQTLCCIPGAGPVTLRSFHSLRCSSP